MLTVILLECGSTGAAVAAAAAMAATLASPSAGSQQPAAIGAPEIERVSEAEAQRERERAQAGERAPKHPARHGESTVWLISLAAQWNEVRKI